MPAPTQAPAPRTVAADADPFPGRTSLAGDGWPDVLVREPGGAIRMVTTEGILDYPTRVDTSGPWSAMRFIAAVGDVTGDGKGDVLARSVDGVRRVSPGDGRVTSAAGDRADQGLPIDLR